MERMRILPVMAMSRSIKNMNTRNTILSVAALLAVASCSIEEYSKVGEQNVKELTITATREDISPETRTVRTEDGKGSILWTPGDKISLFYGSGSNGGSEFTSQATENSKVTNFTGTIGVITGGADVSPDDTYFWGLYPYDEGNECSSGGVTMNLPSHQVATAGSFAPNTYLSIGRSRGLSMAFYNVCCALSIQVVKEGVRKVTMKSLDGTPIAGRIRVELNESGLPYVKEVLDGSDEIVLEAPEGEYLEVGKDYFIVLLPHEFTSSYFTLTFETFTEVGVYERKKAMSFVRSRVEFFGTEASVIPIDKNVTYERKTGNIPIEDANFKAYLVANFDGNGDGEISFEEAGSVDKIDLDYQWEAIRTLNGIEFFENLDTLKYQTGMISSASFWVDEKNGETVDDVVNQMIDAGLTDYNNRPRGLVDELDLSNNKKLRYLYLWGHPMMQGINLKFNTDLTYLNCRGSMKIGSSIDVSNNKKLQTLDCRGCCLQGVLDLSNCSKLSHVDALGNNFTDIILESLPELETISLSSLYLRTIDFSSTPNLKTISISYSQYLERIDVSGCPELRRLTCRAPLDTGGDNRTGYIPYGNLKSLDLSNNSLLEYLDCAGCNLEGTLDLSNCPNLTDVQAFYNDIDELILGNHPNLKMLYLAGCWHLTELNLSGCPALEWISTWSCDELGPVDYTNCTKLKTLYMPPVGSQFSTCEDMELFVIGEPNPDERLVNLPKFPNLKQLSIWHFSSLDLSHNPELETLEIGTTNCTSIDLSPVSKLKKLVVGGWSCFESLDISKNLQLEDVTFEASEALKTLYVAEGQNIEGITVNRSDEKIHPDTEIVVRPDDGGSEVTPGHGNEP